MKVCKDNNRHFWEEIAANSPEATYFHTPQWYDTILHKEHYNGYRPATLVFEFNDNRVLFPCLQKLSSLPFKKKYRIKSDALGWYGGIVPEKPLDNAHYNAVYAYLFHLQRASITVNANPFSPHRLPDAFLLNRDDNFTQAVNLLQNEGAIYAAFSRGVKSNINQAKKKGVQIERGSGSSALNSYYRLYQQTLKRWGAAAQIRYSRSFFERVFQNAGDNATLWIALVNGKPVAGVIVLYWNRVATFWQGAADDTYFSYYPNNLLHWHIICDARKRGYSCYDFGPSGGIDGVVAFKKSFGAAALHMQIGEWKHRWLNRKPVHHIVGE